MVESRVDVIEGTLDKVVYQAEEDGYVVARLSLVPDGEEVTAVGRFAAIQGTQMRLRGAWVMNPKYGRQFQVEEAEIRPPTTLAGIVHYLSSGLIPGIGPIMAKRIVEHFGGETLEVMGKDPERLMEVPGIGPSRIEGIRKAWGRHEGIREVMVFLQGHGVSPGFAHRIFKVYGPQTIARVLQDPYRLTSDVFGIGFKKADGIAKSIGLAPTSMARCRAGLLYTLQTQAEDGHVYLPRGELLEKAGELLGVEQPILEEALDRCVQAGELVLETGGVEEQAYLKWLHDAEVGISLRLASIRRTPTRLSPRAIHPEDLRSTSDGISLNQGQRDILHKALQEKVLVVTGGPGTGKTTAMRALLRVLTRAGAKVALGAPTGRAARRLSEATGCEAKTIHRLLEFQPKQRLFLRNQQRPLTADVVLIDEASMVDTPLMYHLAAAIPKTSSLVLVGDVDQLPSVGPGNVLKDVISSGIAEVVTLREVFRQSARSGIVANAHRVNQGEPPLWERGDRDELSDFYFISQSDPERIQETILELCSERIPKRFGLDPKEEIQVLSPMHRGPLGTEELNRLLHERLNPCRGGIIHGLRRFAEGDKVMQIRNNYDKEVFNGDIGIVSRVDRTDGKVWVRFDGQHVPYLLGELDELVLAYAISVHKSQGSEYPAVIMPLVTQHYLMLQRNLLYTAITRARRLVVIVGSYKALAIAVKNEQIRHRYTGLRARLEKELRGSI
ncbi:MAG: SF1B family DNA helicase RecD2 [Thermodesulfobacteriota bacterium]